MPIATRHGGSVSIDLKTQHPITARRVQVQDDMHFWVMRCLQKTPDISQRQLAKELGISLGSVNYCLQALMDKGWVKVQNFSKSTHKLGYVYLLTPSGIAEKSGLTRRFLSRKIDEYEVLKVEIENLKAEMPVERGAVV
jgi:EPS-associated MarR family transcriptional regulator